MKLVVQQVRPMIRRLILMPSVAAGLAFPAIHSGCGTCTTVPSASAEVDLPANFDGGVPTIDGGFALNCFALCQEAIGESHRCNLVTHDGGTQKVLCERDEYEACSGRRPHGLQPAELARRPAHAGEYFARMAHLEAASIPAFLHLQAELRHHGAPAHLQQAAGRAARDEVKHAAMAARLAQRFGAAPLPCNVDPMSVRPLAELAVENMVEGCVRELFGAVGAAYAAHAARDGRVQKAMRVIAEDETRHAELAWDVAQWLHPQLDAATRQRVAEAGEAALNDLAEVIQSPPTEAMAADLGLPSRHQALAWVEGMRVELFS